MTSKEGKILLTGGAGFIGSNLTRRLVSEGYDVAVLVKPTTNLRRIEDLLPHIKCIQADILDENELKKALKKIDIKGVFHLAASNIQSGVTAPDEDVVKTNIFGSRNLLLAVNDFDYDFFISTGSFLEYGPKKTSVAETDLCQPTELYSITKLAATLYGQTIAKRNKKPILAFRIFTPYGPGIQPGRLIYEIIDKALKGQEINLTGQLVTRDFIFVGDLVDLLMEAKEHAHKYAGEVFNAGSGQATTLETVATEILKITGSKSNIKWGSFKEVAYDDGIWQADLTKTFGSFSWKPMHSLSDGLKETINWFKL